MCGRGGRSVTCIYVYVLELIHVHNLCLEKRHKRGQIFFSLIMRGMIIPTVITFLKTIVCMFIGLKLITPSDVVSPSFHCMNGVIFLNLSNTGKVFKIV